MPKLHSRAHWERALDALRVHTLTLDALRVRWRAALGLHSECTLDALRAHSRERTLECTLSALRQSAMESGAHAKVALRAVADGQVPGD